MVRDGTQTPPIVLAHGFILRLPLSVLTHCYFIAKLGNRIIPAVVQDSTRVGDRGWKGFGTPDVAAITLPNQWTRQSRGLDSRSVSQFRDTKEVEELVVAEG